MLGHLRFGMTENGLSVFQTEFLPHNIRICVTHLVRHPSVNSGFRTSPGDAATIACASDFEKQFVWVG